MAVGWCPSVFASHCASNPQIRSVVSDEVVAVFVETFLYLHS
jgi:hypothetical protein